jgi:hypothetical protein
MQCVTQVSAQRTPAVLKLHVMLLATVCFFSALGLGLPARSSAANLSGFVSVCQPGFNCENVIGTGTPRTASMSRSFPGSGPDLLLASAEVAADFGFFSAHAAASGQMDIAPNFSKGVTGNAAWSTLDRLTITAPGVAGTRGSLNMPIHVTGAVDVGWSASSNATLAGPGAGASFSLSCVANNIGGTIPRRCGGEGGETYTGPTTVDRIVTISVPFDFGVEFEYQLSGAISSGVGYAANGGSGFLQGHADTDFSHTGIFLPGTIVDSNGIVISAPSIISESHYDYLAGFAAIPDTPVPEPATLALTLGSVAALVTVRRLRGRTRM